MGSNYEHVHGNGTPNLHLSMDISANGPTIESYGLSNGGAETDVPQRSTRRFQNAIMGSGQTFPNVSAFRDALYLKLSFWIKGLLDKFINVISDIDKSSNKD